MDPPAGAALAPDRTDLLLHAWELERAGRMVELRALLEGLDPAVLVDEADLGVLLSSTYLHLRDLEAAGRLLERLAPTCRGRRNDRLHRRYLNLTGVMLMHGGRLDASRQVQHELMGKSLAANDASTLLWCTMHLALIHHKKCEWAQAVAHHNRALLLARTVDGGQWLSGVHHNFAYTYRGMGLLDASQRQLDASRRLPRPDYLPLASELERAELARAHGDLDMAQSLALRAHAGYVAHGTGAGIAATCTTLACIEMDRGRLDRARAVLDEARGALSPDEVVEWGELWEHVAVLERLDGRPEESAAAQARATAIYTRMDAPRRIAAMLRRLGGPRSVRLSEIPIHRG